MRLLVGVVLISLVMAAPASADGTGDFCRSRNERVPDELREEADERCSRAAAALLLSPGTGALEKLAELDTWLSSHQHREPPPTSTCDELVEARRRATMRAVDAKVDAEEVLLRELESSQPALPHSKLPRPVRKKVQPHGATVRDPF